MNNFIEFAALPNGMLTFLNLTNANAVGGDVAFLARAPHGINVSASYSYQDATDGDTGAWLTGSPKHLGKLNVDAPLIWPKLHGALEAQYVSKRLTLADNFVNAYTVVNVTLLGQKLTHNLDLSASVYNLFNQTYFDPGAQQHKEDSLQQAGRTFRVKLVWHWGEK
jgi:iron complex outermembrane receptor protein